MTPVPVQKAVPGLPLRKGGETGPDGQSETGSRPVGPAQDETEVGTVLTHRHLAAVSLLAEGRTIEEVARELGIGRTTLYRWRTSPVFAAALAEATARGLGAALERLRCLREGAIGVLEDLLADAAAPAAVRLAAAREVMDRTGLEAGRTDAQEADRPVSPEEEAEVLEKLRRKFAEERGNR